jgi:predicted TIM-barrel fold metal-dependent hydrolase
MASVRKLESYVRDYGFRALHLFPHWIGRPANDAIYYPFYAKCVELDIAVCLQIRMASQSFLKHVARPETIDEVAAYFPELRIVGLHGGWPWLEEFMALMLKHPNFYVTTSSYPPREWDNKFTEFLKGKGQDKVIFGSGAPMLKDGIKGYLAALRQFELSEETQRKYFRDNARKVFKLEDPTLVSCNA